MRSLLGVVLCAPVLLGLPAVRGAAQEGPQTTLVITVAGGVHSGHGLYEINRQPMPVLSAPSSFDTLRVVRSVGSGLILGFSGTYFPSGLVGFHGELTFVDLPLESSCDSIYAATAPPPDPNNDPRNFEICGNLDGSSVSSSVFGFMAGVTLRTAARGFLVPYLRGSLGASVTSASSVSMEGYFVQGGQIVVQPIVVDDDPKLISLGATVAAGLTGAVGSGYQLRLEVRDDYFSLERATGAANTTTGVAPKETRYYHHWSLLIGFDVVLERKRGRRY